MQLTKRGLRIKHSFGDRLLMIIIYALLIALFVALVYPLVFIMSASISDSYAVYSGKMILWPVGPTLEGYRYILNYSEIWLGYANTIFYTVVGTIISLLFTLPCAYALSRRDLAGRNFLMGIFIVTMYFSGGLIPYYLNVNALGLLNTRTIVLLYGAFSVFNMIVARTFFTTTIPSEIEDAAKVDGCTDVQTFLRIVLPISQAIVVVMILYYAVARWNSYFMEMILLDSRELFPLQLFLREILIQSQFAANAMSSGTSMSAAQMAQLLQQVETANKVKYCVIIVSTLPMLIVYPFLQKYFEKGIMLGSIKG